MFEIRPTKAYKFTNSHLFDNDGKNPVVTNSSLNNGISGYSSLEPTEKGNQITYSDTTTSDGIFYQKRPFVGYSHVQGLYPLKYHEFWNEKTLLFVVIAFRKSAFGRFDYGNKFNRKIASEMKISLPLKPSTLNTSAPTLEDIDFNFMENFIAELEQCRLAELEQCRLAELDAYLQATGLKNTILNSNEENALQLLSENERERKTQGSLEWKSFKLGDLFNHIKQGRRLKKEDQIKGYLPFVMSGVTNSGVMNYVSNAIAIFPKNSITIDIFGNTFYRNYDFGAGDDTGVYWSDAQNYTKETMLFFAVSISKSLKNKFSYGKKLRSSQSIDFNIILPTNDGELDFNFMQNLINALQKQIIKAVVEYNDAKIQATKQVIEKDNPQIIRKESLF
ncbi:restriction endonuclease subunit S [Helicobacter cetorum]|uniref:restriction endonuclease subunit S n=1 Tax=Helicobacter cetorum TaxID=138563 RepID=UPI001F481C9A|nr:restriction endonuclease subunit S [Helicobacter cetorum]